jgi:AraC family transcriptional regulator, regulatory protein of adaptative response / methylated-DNA-[protein]-cysteine methyltransferase
MHSPNIALALDQEGLPQTIAKAGALVDAPHRGTDLALDMRGSPMEMAIWDALRTITGL